MADVRERFAKIGMSGSEMEDQALFQIASEPPNDNLYPLFEKQRAVWRGCMTDAEITALFRSCCIEIVGHGPL